MAKRGCLLRFNRPQLRSRQDLKTGACPYLTVTCDPHTCLQRCCCDVSLAWTHEHLKLNTEQTQPALIATLPGRFGKQTRYAFPVILIACLNCLNLTWVKPNWVKARECKCIAGYVPNFAPFLTSRWRQEAHLKCFTPLNSPIKCWSDIAVLCCIDRSIQGDRWLVREMPSI